VHDRAAVIFARYVSRQAHVDHALGGQYIVDVNGAQARVRLAAHADGNVQEIARLGEVVRVGRPAAYVQVCAPY
jgi:hypothetical protein